MLLSFYLDTHVDKQVAIQLRQKGVQAIRCEDVEMATAGDEAHLEYASEHQLCLITKDAGFRARHFRWLDEGKFHYGIFYCKDRNIASIGKIVNTCFEFFQLIEDGAGTIDDIQNEFFEIV